jgi:phosphonatase-like hydrolase
VVDIEVAAVDMAGTTVRDGGLVEEAFTAAITSVGVPAGSPRFDAAVEYVRATMGESKIAVFSAILDGDVARARIANAAFEQAYADLIEGGALAAVPGAEETITRMRAAGIKVALTTGFSPATQALIIDALGWRQLVDLWLAPADVGRGRPFPDLALGALLRLGGSRVQALAVVGDTAADIRSGVNAGAGCVVGVLTGAHDDLALRHAGATHVLSSVAELPALLEI